MGGYGALHLGLKYPNVFGAVSSIAPTLHIELSNERLERIRDTFGDNTEYYKAQAPWNLVRDNAVNLAGKTRVRLLTGKESETAQQNMEFMCRLLTEVGVQNEIRQNPDAPHEYVDIMEYLDDQIFAFWREVFQE